MMTVFELLKNSGIVPGGIVVSAAGHDKGRIYLVVSVDDKIAYLCDGIYRGIENPKKKRATHLILTGFMKDSQQKIKKLEDAAKTEFKNQLIQRWITEYIIEYDEQGKEK